MGLSTKKTSSTTNQTTSGTTSSTTTPTNPAWVDSGLAGLGATLSNLGTMDPKSFVAGPNALQTQAAGGAANLGNYGGYGGSSASPYATGGDDFGGGRSGTLSAGSGASGTPFGGTFGGTPNDDPTLPGRFNSTMNSIGFSGSPAPAAGGLIGATQPAGAGQSGGSANPFTDAMNTFKGLTNSDANTYSANTYAPTNAHAASLLDNLGAYMNPYTNDVVNTTLAGFDKNAGMTRATQALAEAKNQSFGGSGAALTRSLTEGELAQQRASTEAGLRDQAFNTGANLSNLDAGRRQDVSLANANAANSAGQFNANSLNSAGQFNAGQKDNAANRQLTAAQGLTNTATAFGNDARANATTQSDIGSVLQQIQQNQAAAPLATAGALSSMWNTMPLSLLHGGTTDGTVTGSMNGNSTTKESGASLSDWMNMLSNMAKAAAAGG